MTFRVHSHVRAAFSLGSCNYVFISFVMDYFRKCCLKNEVDKANPLSVKSKAEKVKLTYLFSCNCLSFITQFSICMALQWLVNILPEMEVNAQHS